MIQEVKRNMGKKYFYKAFGMYIASDIMLPEFHGSIAENADVQILYGEVPNEIYAPRETDEDYQVAENEFLLRVEGVAGYYVTNGEQIVVEPCSQANPREVRLYLLGTAIGVLLLQRGILPIHGSAVVIGGCCVVFCGVSGAGKSTAAAALRKRGYALLTDDLSAIQFDDKGLPWVQPGYPQQKLWQATASMIGIDTAPFYRISEDEDKYSVPVQAGFWENPMPLAAVYEIDVQPGNDVVIRSFAGMEKLATIMNHTYRAELLDGLGLKNAHFQKCAKIIKRIPVFRLIRPEGMSSLDTQVNMLEQHFANIFCTSGQRINSMS